MYEGKILGKNIRLRNKDYKSILYKWNPDRVDREKRSIFLKCSLCTLYLNNAPECRGCPLQVFENEDEPGCSVVIIGIIGKRGYDRIGLDPDYLGWGQIGESTMKKYMQKIQDVLATFKKV